MIYEIRNFISGKPLTRKNTRKTKWPTLIRGTVMQNKKKKTIEEDGHIFIHSSTLFLSSLFYPSFEARESRRGRESLGMRLFVHWNDLFVNSRTGYLSNSHHVLIGTGGWWISYASTYWCHIRVCLANVVLMSFMNKKNLNILFVRNITWWTQSYNFIFYV